MSKEPTLLIPQQLKEQLKPLDGVIKIDLSIIEFNSPEEIINSLKFIHQSLEKKKFNFLFLDLTNLSLENSKNRKWAIKISSIKKLKKTLVALSLSYTEIKPKYLLKILKKTSAFIELAHIKLAGFRLNKKITKKLVKFIQKKQSDIISLVLDQTRFSPDAIGLMLAALKILLENKQFSFLSLQSCNLQPATLRLLLNYFINSPLKKLDISGNEFPEKIVDGLFQAGWDAKKFTEPKTLIIKKSKIGPGIFGKLIDACFRNSSLIIEISKGEFDPEGYVHKTLEYVLTNGTQGTAENSVGILGENTIKLIEAWVPAQYIEKYSIFITFVVEAIVTDLRGFKELIINCENISRKIIFKLKKLEIHPEKLHPNELIQLLKTGLIVSEITISSYQLETNQLNLVASLLRQKKDIRSLHLTNNRLNNSHCDVLANLLACSNIEFIDLSLNNIGENGALLLKDGLTKNYTINKFMITGNHPNEGEFITDETTQSFYEITLRNRLHHALKKNDSAEALEIINECDDRGINVDDLTNLNQETPLYVAINLGILQIVRRLCGACDWSKPNKNGIIPKTIGEMSQTPEIRKIFQNDIALERNKTALRLQKERRNSLRKLSTITKNKHLVENAVESLVKQITDSNEGETVDTLNAPALEELINKLNEYEGLNAEERKLYDKLSELEKRVENVTSRLSLRIENLEQSIDVKTRSLSQTMELNERSIREELDQKEDKALIELRKLNPDQIGYIFYDRFFNRLSQSLFAVSKSATQYLQATESRTSFWGRQTAKCVGGVGGLFVPGVSTVVEVGADITSAVYESFRVHKVNTNVDSVIPTADYKNVSERIVYALFPTLDPIISNKPPEFLELADKIVECLIAFIRTSEIIKITKQDSLEAISEKISLNEKAIINHIINLINQDSKFKKWKIKNIKHEVSSPIEPVSDNNEIASEGSSEEAIDINYAAETERKKLEEKQRLIEKEKKARIKKYKMRIKKKGNPSGSEDEAFSESENSLNKRSHRFFERTNSSLSHEPSFDDYPTPVYSPEKK